MADNFNPAISDTVTESVTQKLEGFSNDPPPAQTEATQNVSESQGESQAQPQTQAEAAQEAVEQLYEFDRAGQRHKLKKSEVDYIVNFGLDAYQRAMEAKNAPQLQQQYQAPQQPAQSEDPQAKLMGRIEALERQLESANTERQIEQIKRNLEAAVEKVEVYKGLKNPEHQGLFKSLVMMEQYSNPSLSPESAAEAAGNKLAGLLRDRASAYVQGKVEQAQRRVESKGNVAATPQGPLGAKDLRNGNVLKSAIQRLTQYVSS